MTNDGNNTLVYDAENRVLSATNGSASGSYTYDGNNLRVKKVSGSTTTVYIFSGSRVIAEYSGTSSPYPLAREYIYSGSALLAKIEAGVTNYYHSDHLSARVITDSSGVSIGQRAHYPYGETWYETGTTTKIKFTSYERDSESGNDFAMARYYVNRLGRFNAPDLLSGSISDPQSLNRYAYVVDDPLNLVDPTGMFYGPCGPLDELCPTSPGGGRSGSGGIGSARQTKSLNAPPVGIDEGGGPDGGAGACIDPGSLSFLQRMQLYAAQTYAKLTGWTIGFGVGADAGAGGGPKGTSWNFGVGGSGSTMIVADASGNAGLLNSASGGLAGIKMKSAGSWFGAGFAAGPSVLFSPRSIDKIKGRSGSVSGGGGAVLGAGASISTSGAVTVTFGVGAGAEAGFSPQFGTSQFIPFCHN